MNTSIKIIGFTRRAVQPKSLIPETDALSTRPSELFTPCYTGLPSVHVFAKLFFEVHSRTFFFLKQFFNIDEFFNRFFSQSHFFLYQFFVHFIKNGLKNSNYYAASCSVECMHFVFLDTATEKPEQTTTVRRYQRHVLKMHYSLALCYFLAIKKFSIINIAVSYILIKFPEKALNNLSSRQGYSNRSQDVTKLQKFTQIIRIPCSVVGLSFEKCFSSLLFSNICEEAKICSYFLSKGELVTQHPQLPRKNITTSNKAVQSTRSGGPV